MQRRLAFVLAVVICTFSSPPALHAQDADDPARKFIGTWRLITTIQRKADGSSGPNPTYGPKGIGYIIYTDAGVMCATLTNPEQPKWENTAAPTPEELKSGKNSFHAYCGRYTVHPSGGYVVHHVEMDNIPNDVNIDRKRFFQFTGNRLLLTADPPPTGTTEYTLTWERVEK